MMTRLKVLLALIALISGCSQADEGAGKTGDQDTAQSTSEHVWKDQTETLQKARDAEKLLEEAQQKRAGQLDDPPSAR